MRANVKMYLPNKDSRPHASHIPKLIPTEPVRTSNPDGDTNIPDPKRQNEHNKSISTGFDSNKLADIVVCDDSHILIVCLISDLHSLCGRLRCVT